MKLHLTYAVILLPITVFCQDQPATQTLPSHLLGEMSSKAQNLGQQISRQTVQYLAGFSKQEESLRRKLSTRDSTANSLFAYSAERYANLMAQVQSEKGSPAAVLNGPYLAHADSLRVSLAFLQQHPEWLSGPGVKTSTAGLQNRLSGLAAQWQQVQSKLKDADQVRQFIRQRKAQIGAYLERLSGVSSAVRKLYQGYSQSLYYYAQQIGSYKQALNNPGPIEQKALAVLSKQPAFGNFMKKNSQLAQLFGGANTGTAPSIAGLQSKQSVQDLIQSKVAGGGPKAEGSMTGQLSIAGLGLASLQQRVSKLGDAGQDMDDPDFKPNSQKTKTFFSRLEYGVSIQTQSSSLYYPTTTNLGLTLGYRLNDNNSIGVGASALVGWGSDIRHIAFTGSGFGLRSFADIHFRQTWYFSGGLEYNYQPPTGPGKIPGLRSWQQSGLVGISKIVSVKSRVLKKTKVQLLWDFLSYSQTPQTPPFKFRIGYGF